MSAELSINQLLKKVNDNPADYKSRLALARKLYADGLVNLATREVETLVQQLPDNQPLRRLLERFDPGALRRISSVSATTATAAADQQIAAEAEIDFDAIDLLDDSVKKQ